MEVEDATQNEATEVKSGWADSMARILGSNKPKHKKTLILSRAKKDFEIKKKVETTTPASAPIPVVKLAEDGDDIVDVRTEDAPPVKKAKLDSSEDPFISVKAQRKLELKQRRQLQEWENLNRSKPDPAADKSRERELVKIATKGVVQLFNAVNLQQKALKEKLRGANKSEFKKDKVLHQSKQIFDSAMVKSKRLGTDYNSDSDEDETEVKEEGSESDEEFGGPATTGSFTFKTKSTGSTASISAAVNGKSKPTRTSKSTTKKPNFKALHDDYMMGSATVKQWNDNIDEDEESE